MDRTLAEFPDGKMASSAVEQLVAKSFAIEDLELHAVAADGSTTSIPIRHQSQALNGFLLGGLFALPIGIAMVLSLGITASPSLGLLAVGLGCTVGATLGIGWWNVRVDRTQMPGDASRYVIVVRGPEARAVLAQSVMQEAGGSDATPRATSAAPE